VTSFSTPNKMKLFRGTSRQLLRDGAKFMATCFRYPTTLAISTDSISTAKTNSSFHKTQQILLACLYRIPSKATKEKADTACMKDGCNQRLNWMARWRLQIPTTELLSATDVCVLQTSCNDVTRTPLIRNSYLHGVQRVETLTVAHILMKFASQSQSPRGLRHELSSPSRTMESWVPIPIEA
jgi:hypothetical protein